MYVLISSLFITYSFTPIIKPRKRFLKIVNQSDLHDSHVGLYGIFSNLAAVIKNTKTLIQVNICHNCHIKHEKHNGLRCDRSSLSMLTPCIAS